MTSKISLALGSVTRLLSIFSMRRYQLEEYNTYSLFRTKELPPSSGYQIDGFCQYRGLVYIRRVWPIARPHLPDWVRGFLVLVG